MSEETILGVIQGLHYRKGFLRYEPCTLVVTARRLLVAWETIKVRVETREISIGEHYRALSPEAILAETQRNFSVEGRAIGRIRLDLRVRRLTSYREGGHRLTFWTPEGRHVFVFREGSLPADATRALIDRAGWKPCETSLI